MKVICSEVYIQVIPYEQLFRPKNFDWNIARFKKKEFGDLSILDNRFQEHPEILTAPITCGKKIIQPEWFQEVIIVHNYVSDAFTLPEKFPILACCN